MRHRTVYRAWLWAPYMPILVPALATVVAAAGLGLPGLQSGQLIALVGIALTLVFFDQRHRLEATRTLNELATQFNQRYAELNQDLQALVAQGTESPSTRDTLNDYINLCAEEYLFYALGLIHPEAWKSWRSGAAWYLKHSEAVRQHFRTELDDGSYYGLTWSQLQAE